MKGTRPFVQQVVESSSHDLVSFGKGWQCRMCGGSVSSSARSCRDWLSSKCVVLPYDDRIRHVPSPPWYTIHVGTTTVHHTHVAHCVKGIVFCITCGHFGARKLVKLARPCTGHTTAASAAQLLPATRSSRSPLRPYIQGFSTRLAEGGPQTLGHGACGKSFRAGRSVALDMP